MNDLKLIFAYWLILMVFGIATAASVGAEELKLEDLAPPTENTKAPPKDQPKDQQGEVDISDIQNQYWKAHDKEFEVIQNKQYTKTGKIELAPVAGIYQRVDYQDTKTLGAAISYHFSEFVGAELMAYKMFATQSHVLSRFQETTGATIEFNPEKYYIGGSAIITPIYGKFSLLGKKISHFDLYLAPGAGMTKTIGAHFTPSIGVGQKFWISPKWNFRVEYRWMQYHDSIPTTQGTSAVKNGGPGYFEDIITNQNLIFGVSYLFN